MNAVELNDETLVTASNLGALAQVPQIARRAFEVITKFNIGILHIRLPDGRWFRFEGKQPGPEAYLQVHDYALVKRFFDNGDVGIAEGFIDGEWSSPDVTAFLELFARNTRELAGNASGKFLNWLLAIYRHWQNRNTRDQAKRNISAHYDMGNSFYAAWLDGGMTYSSGLFSNGDSDLSSAQQRKYRALADALDLQPQHTVLEIGCGWGGFAEFAAREIGCHVTALTISREQLVFAQKRIDDAGLQNKVTFKFQDYRDESGVYDRIASIEMFEAVGEKFWPVYFGKLKDNLISGGRAGLQVITIRDTLWKQYRSEVDFIRRYIFPGGMLPTPGLMKTLGERFGLKLEGQRIFGLDYAQTLSQWRERFLAAWPQLLHLGFDERFKRLWSYYLHYCEAGFLSENIDVRQLVYVKP